MEGRDILKNLVSNKFMPEFNYFTTRISFNTVFFRSLSSYCCCTCAYEHEYLEYLSDDGAVNEDLYESVVTNIINGECEHVKHAPKECVRETYVYGVHIAAAVGTTKVFKGHEEQIIHVNSGIFRVSPCASAALKSSCKVFDVLRNRYPTYDALLSRGHLCIRRSSQNTPEFEVKNFTLIEIATLKQNARLLKSILDFKFVPAGITAALRIVFKQKLLALQKILLDYIVGLANRGKFVNALFCAETTIVFNETTPLETIVQSIASKRPRGILNHWLGETCSILKRNDCRDIIIKYDTDSLTPRPIHQRVAKLFYLLENFHETCKDEVVASFLSDAESLDEFRKIPQHKGSRVHTYLNPNKRRIDTCVLRTMFDLGLSIDTTDSAGNTPLTQILKLKRACYINYRDLRVIMETLVFENPDMSLNDEATSFALDIDTETQTNSFSSSLENSLSCNVTMDAEYHTIRDFCNNKALNFLCPFLIDCGFHVKRDMLINALDDGNLPSEELMYFQQYLEEPRSLMLTCRDSLRKHFKGRKLHTFLEGQEIPKTIRNYILIQLV